MRSTRVAQTTFDVTPGRSAVLIKARSSVGPISFATSDVRGQISAGVDADTIGADAPVAGQPDGVAHVAHVGQRPLRHRAEAADRRAALPRGLLAAGACGQGATATNRYDLTARLEIHDVVRPLVGFVTVEPLRRDVLVVRGQQTLDIREFDLDVPTTLALKIYPEVSVEMHLEAQARPPGGRDG